MQYMKFKRNPVTNDLECPQVEKDSQLHLWLAFIVQMWSAMAQLVVR